MQNWVIEDVLATSPRPGFRPGPEHSVPVGVVEDWLREADLFGIRSVICLIGADQLWLYRKSVPGGLISAYRSAGFEVEHISTQDQQTHPFTPEDLERAWQAFTRMPKPVLVHCSAGMDRTGRVVAHILRNLGETKGSVPAD
ncbi:MAG: tyrosine-protein phosphatase [Tepidiformaceae bacterium]